MSGCLSPHALPGGTRRDERSYETEEGSKSSQIKRNSVSLSDRQEWEEGQCMHLVGYCNKEVKGKSKAHMEKLGGLELNRRKEVD